MDAASPEPACRQADLGTGLSRYVRRSASLSGKVLSFHSQRDRGAGYANEEFV